MSTLLSSGSSDRVAVIGSGLGGLAAACTLAARGRQVTLFEANDWVGGRLLTARNGSTIEEVGGPRLDCRFDEGLYLNAGAGRIPHHHTETLGLCRELSVPLESFVLASRASFLFDVPEDGNAALNAHQARRVKHNHMRQIRARATHRASPVPRLPVRHRKSAM